MASIRCSGIVAPRALSFFTASFSGIASLVTIIGNFAVCLAVYKDPFGKLRTPFMYFLVNLSLSDLVVGCITMPTSVATHTMEAIGTKKKEHVDLILTTYFISATASLLSLAVLCVDRYFAVAFPVFYRRNATFKKCITTSVIIWVVSLSLPVLYFVTGYMTYLMIFAHTGVVVAFTILFFTYFKIVKALREQTQKLATRVSPGPSTIDQTTTANHLRSEKAVKTERRVTRVFIIILSLFAASYIPVIVIIYVLQFCSECDCTLRHVLRDLQFLLAISNSAVNPFICTLRLKPFRVALRKICGFRHAPDLYTTSSSAEQNRRALQTNGIVSAQV